MSSGDARRWIEGFEAAARADRDAKRKRGPRPAWSIALALSLLKAGRLAAGQPLVDPRREEQDEAVRRLWQRLRSRLLP